MNDEELKLEAIRAALCMENHGTTNTLLENARLIYDFLKGR